MNNQITDQIKADLLESFEFYANPKYTGYDPVRPVAKIIFSAQGEITSPPDLEFMGYGGGSEGEAFDACGGFNLEPFFPLDTDGEYFEDDDEEFISKCLQKAGEAVLESLQSIATSEAFLDIPKEGPIVFVLNIVDQKSKVICRIHPDGQVELPPKKN
ncbi:hypothetical protein [Aquimarina sp. 433]